MSSVVSVLFVFKASANALTPSSPILFKIRINVASVVFVFKAVAISIVPSIPILLAER